MQLQKHQIVDGLSEAVGEQKAEQLIKRATAEAGVRRQRSFEKDEALRLIDQIATDDDADTMVRVSANTLKTQIRSGQIRS